MMKNEYMSPKEDSPIDTPDEWEGGSVVNTGGGIMARRWRLEEGDKIYRVTYGKPFDGVDMELYEEGEFEGIVDSREATDKKTDMGCAKIALEMMENIIE